MNRFEMSTQRKGSDSTSGNSSGETAQDHSSVKTIENYGLVTRLSIPTVSIVKSAQFYRKGEDLLRDPRKMACKEALIWSPTFQSNISVGQPGVQLLLPPCCST